MRDCGAGTDAGGAPTLTCGDRSWTLATSGVMIGRDARADVHLDHPEVSRRHARLSLDAAAGWFLEDLGSVNGTFVDGQRVSCGPVSPGTQIRLGPSPDAPTLTLTGAADAADIAGDAPRRDGAAPDPPTRGPAPSGPPAAGPTTPGSPPPGPAAPTVTIGRAGDNTLIVDDLLASRYHARATRRPDGFWVEDLGSLNGTHVNGQAVTAALVRPGDLLTIGHFELGVTGGQLVMRRQRREVSLTARDLRVVLPGGKQLLRSVDFALPSASLMAVVGPSGAGKSTLLAALTGSRKATNGQVTFDGRDLYANFSELRHRIGLVPQDDVVHRQLTVRQALEYASQLRFPADLDAVSRRARIDQVVAELELAPHVDTRIDRLSGGQRKRTSVALELLTEPSLLFLDEPTSGLDPGLDKSVMGTLRTLADSGRTVVVVTHNVANLGVCDRVLLLAPGGQVAYFGPPERILEYFGCDDHSDVFTYVAAQPEAAAARFRRSAAREDSNADLLPARADAPAAPPLRQQSILAQGSTLARRHLRVLLADRSYLLFMLALPVFLALLVLAVPGAAGFGRPSPGGPTEALQLLVVLIVGAAFMGIASSVRDLVAERAIYRREKGVGLSTVAYLGAKLAVFGGLALVQSAALVAVVALFTPGPAGAAALGHGWLELYGAGVGTAYCCAALGLLVSAAVSTSEQVMPLLVVGIMAQLVLCGGLIPVADQAVLAQLSWLAPSRWGYAAGAATVQALAIPTVAPDPLWEHAAGNWWRCLAVLAAITVLLVAATGWRLARTGSAR